MADEDRLTWSRRAASAMRHGNHTANTRRWMRPAHGCNGAEDEIARAAITRNRTANAPLVSSAYRARPRQRGSGRKHQDKTAKPTHVLKKKTAPIGW